MFAAPTQASSTIWSHRQIADPSSNACRTFAIGNFGPNAADLSRAKNCCCRATPIQHNEQSAGDPQILVP